MPAGRAVVLNSGQMYGFVCAHEGNYTAVTGVNGTGTAVDNCNGMSISIQSRLGSIIKYNLRLDTPDQNHTSIKALVSFSQPVDTSIIRSETSVSFATLLLSVHDFAK